MAPANDATLTVNEMFSVGLINSVRGSGCHLKSDHQSVFVGQVGSHVNGWGSPIGVVSGRD